MNASLTWLALSESLQLVMRGGVHESRAQAKICKAVAELKIYVKVEIDARDESGEAGDAFERNEVEIPTDLGVDDFIWARSRPIQRWRTRRENSGADWALHRISLVQLCREDVLHWCGDIDDVRLPMRTNAGDDAATTNSRNRWKHFAQDNWVPSEGVAAAIPQIAAAPAREVSLSEAVSLMAFGSRSAPEYGDETEIFVRQTQAGRALCAAAENYDVQLRGNLTREDAEVHDIPRSRPLRLGLDPDVLIPDYERTEADAAEFEESGRHIARNSNLRGHQNQEWFNVRVTAESLAVWLATQAKSERWRELRRWHSRRLFEYPFWSIDTTLCWVAFRDRNRLGYDASAIADLSRRVTWRRGSDDPMLESQPEIALTIALQSGKLAAIEDGAELRREAWANVQPCLGRLDPARDSARLCGQDVVRVFPEPTRLSVAQIIALRRARVTRLAERIRKTRKWIRLADIVNLGAGKVFGKSTSDLERRRAIALLRASILAGEFRSNCKSCVMLLSPGSSVIRVSCWPPALTTVLDDFGHEEFVQEILEECWLPNELCRLWFERHRLEWPAYFEVRKAPSRSEAKDPGTSRTRGRPTDLGLYLAEFELSTKSRKTKGTLKEEANLLSQWAANNPAVKAKIKPGTIANAIREPYKQWDVEKLKN